MHKWKRARARVRRNPGELNGTEIQYAKVLEQRRDAGEIAGYSYESHKLRLADLTFYTPDFYVQLADGTIEFHEVKACRANGKFLAEDDAMVKIKVAAEQFPQYGFLLCGKLPKKSGGGWKIQAIS